MNIDHQAWAEEQIQALLSLGMTGENAGRVIRWVLTHLPPDANPDTWIPPPDLLDGPVEDDLDLE